MRGPRSFTFPSLVPFSFISMKSERAWVPLLPRRLVDHSRMFEMKFENFVRYPILNIQVNLFQKHLFLYQLTHNMTKDCSLNYEFSTWKFQAQNMLRTCCAHKLFFVFVLTFKPIYTHNIFSPCSELVVSCTELVNQWTIFCHIVG